MKEIEIICVNDGSTDSSGEIINTFAKNDKRIIVVHQANRGLVNARKVGLRYANAEYVGYVDGDDWIRSDMYEKLYSAAIRSNADIVSCGYYREYDNEIIIERDQLGEGYYSKNQMEQFVYPFMFHCNELEYNSILDRKVTASIWSKLFRRSKLMNHQMPVDEKITFGEDSAVVYPYLLDSDVLFVLNECLYHYRSRRTGSIMNSSNLNFFRSIDALYSYLYKTFMNSDYAEIMIPQLNAYIDRKIFTASKYLFGSEAYLQTKSYILPFDEIEKGDRIIIYAAGQVGCYYYRQAVTLSCFSKVLWVDKDAEKYRKLGFPVQDIESISGSVYDKLIIAVEREQLANHIKKELLQLGVPEEKIIWKNPMLKTV